MKKNFIIAAACLIFFTAGYASKNISIINISPKSLPPGLERNGNPKVYRNTPPGWSKGRKNGWNKDRAGNRDYSVQFNLGRDVTIQK